jgi:hypothetical protein
MKTIHCFHNEEQGLDVISIKWGPRNILRLVDKGKILENKTIARMHNHPNSL